MTDCKRHEILRQPGKSNKITLDKTEISVSTTIHKKLITSRPIDIKQNKVSNRKRHSNLIIFRK